MKSNMGMADRAIRIIAAAVIGALYYGHIISGAISIVLLIIAVVFALTSLVGFCPLYKLLGISTCSVKKNVDN